MALLVFLVDQLAKWWIIERVVLPERGSVELLPIFRLIWVENRGVSLGLLVASTDAQRWLLVALTGAIALGCLAWLQRERNRWDALALGLVVGGAAGNIVDRVRLGYVADFLNLHFGEWSPFLVFNVADAAISVGVVLLVGRAFRARAPDTEKS